MEIVRLIEQFYGWVCCEVKALYPDTYSFEFGKQSNLDHNSLHFQPNEIKTTKYNPVNFFPKAMLLQYKRLANLYFLVVAVLSTIPGVTPLSPALIWMPLVFVLVVSIIKQAYEDYHRYKIDKQINNQNSTSVIRCNQLVQVTWGQVIVGDICLVKEDQSFPADMILISSCQDDGIAYIDTASLDGEKTSKIRYAFSEISANYKTVDDMKKLGGAFDGEVPTQSLEIFRGNLTIDNHRFNIVDSKQLLYRGAKLRNTKEVWCLAAYTGQCSKIILNSQLATNKISGVEKRLNIMLVCLFICQIILCIVISQFAMVTDSALMPISPYISWSGLQPTPLKQFIRYMMMFFIDYSSLIPISLIVSMEIVKLAQSYFIDFDKLMFSDMKDRGVLAKNINLNEELGQIEYVFTDKTGTLTSNKMTFHTAVMGSSMYQFEHTPDECTYTCQAYEGKANSQEAARLVNSIELLSEDGKEGLVLKTEQQINHQYMMALLVCNSVNVVTKGEKVIYESESPDQLALIRFAKSLGYVFEKRDLNFIKAEVNGRPITIKIHQKFTFTSDRKRMSVLAQINNQYYLYTKGADNIISERIKASTFEIDSKVMELSRKGLRTLMVAMKVVSSQEYLQFKRAIDASDFSSRDQVFQHFSNRFETNLTLIGATALLDQLQVGVPQTLRDFQRAGIRVWMLTGDKLQTAIEVSKSCNLIEKNYQIIECRPNHRSIMDEMEEWKMMLDTNPTRKTSLVIEGSKLAEIIADEQYSKKFAFLTQEFVTVICCRLLPIQKAHTVKLIKDHLKQICLSIGDGGNDVSMIKEAHIGIGLYGQEGMSAVQASDYAIPQFRMIWRLMFVHGRWNYIRIGEMILYFTYKSLLFTIPRVVFALYNAFSGQPIFDDYYIALYNVLFTSVPLLVRALFEQDVNYVIPKKDDEEVEQMHVGDVLASSELKYLPKGFRIDPVLRSKFPKIYFVSKNHQIFNFFSCLVWIFEAVGLAIITTTLILNLIGTLPINSNGYNSDLWMSSIEIYTTIIILNTIKIAMHVRHWTKLFLTAIIGCSLGPYLIYIWISNYTLEKYVSGTVIMCFQNLITYFVFILLCSLSIVIISLILYITFHSNKAMKKIRLRMLEMRGESDAISEESKLEQLEMQTPIRSENIRESGMPLSFDHIYEKISIKPSVQT